MTLEYNFCVHILNAKCCYICDAVAVFLQVFSYTADKEIRTDDLCLDASRLNGPILMLKCHHMKGNQMFEYDAEVGFMFPTGTRKCKMRLCRWSLSLADGLCSQNESGYLLIWFELYKKTSLLPLDGTLCVSFFCIFSFFCIKQHRDWIAISIQQLCFSSSLISYSMLASGSMILR